MTPSATWIFVSGIGIGFMLCFLMTWVVAVGYYFRLNKAMGVIKKWTSRQEE